MADMIDTTHSTWRGDQSDTMTQSASQHADDVPTLISLPLSFPWPRPSILCSSPQLWRVAHIGDTPETSYDQPNPEISGPFVFWNI